MARLTRGMLPLAAAALVGVWLWRQPALVAPDAEPATSFADSTGAIAPASSATARPAAQGRLPGMTMPPPIESASPNEIAALRQAEVEHSLVRPPVASYVGPDGKQHAFRYETTQQEAAKDRAREERESELMRELQADPAAFASRYGLKAREIERILDGSMPFPPAMLD